MSARANFPQRGRHWVHGNRGGPGVRPGVPKKPSPPRPAFPRLRTSAAQAASDPKMAHASSGKLGTSRGTTTSDRGDAAPKGPRCSRLRAPRVAAMTCAQSYRARARWQSEAVLACTWRRRIPQKRTERRGRQGARLSAAGPKNGKLGLGLLVRRISATLPGTFPGAHIFPGTPPRVIEEASTTIPLSRRDRERTREAQLGQGERGGSLHEDRD
jgi:hypothetical protein